jgi:hypothetical protein
MNKKPGPKPADMPYTDKGWLELQYFKLGKSKRTIAREIGCGETVIHKWFHRFGLKPRTISQALIGHKRSEEHIENLIKAHSTEKYLNNFALKDKNPHWKGGVHKVNQKDRSKLGYFRKFVKDRAGNKCEWCGSSENLVAHHPLSWIDYPNLRFNTDNGMCLCKKCHINYHYKRGELGGTPEKDNT